jgi:hypothetical protein
LVKTITSSNSWAIRASWSGFGIPPVVRNARRHGDLVACGQRPLDAGDAGTEPAGDDLVLAGDLVLEQISKARQASSLVRTPSE